VKYFGVFLHKKTQKLLSFLFFVYIINNLYIKKEIMSEKLIELQKEVNEALELQKE
jgi:hypothetical protein